MKANYLLRKRGTLAFCYWQMPGSPMAALVFASGEDLYWFRRKVIPKTERESWEAVKMTDQQLVEIMKEMGGLYLFTRHGPDGEAGYAWVSEQAAETMLAR